MGFKEDLDPSVLHNQKETFVLLGVINFIHPSNCLQTWVTKKLQQSLTGQEI